MSNTKIMGYSRFDDNPASATSQALPVNNLLTPQPRQIWRSSDTGDQVLQFDAGEVTILDSLYLGNHNLTADATVRIQVSRTNDFSDLLYDYTITLNQPVYGLGEGPLGVNGLGGFADGSISFAFLLHEFVPEGLANATSLPVTGRHIRLTISDVGNKVGYLQAGRLKAGVFLTTKVGPRYGYQWGVVDGSRSYRTRGGALRSNVRPNYRAVKAQWVNLDDFEASSFGLLLDEVSHVSDVLFMGYPDNNSDLGLWNMFLARVVNHSLFATPNASNQHTLSIDFEEEL